MRFGAIAVACAALGSVAIPAIAQESSALDAITVSAKFDKSEYLIGETATISLTVTNTGTEAVTDVSGLLTGDLYARQSDWTGIDAAGGQTIEPGVTVDATVKALVRNARDKTVDVEVGVLRLPSDRKVVPLTAAKIVKTGDFTGTVYFDANGNGKVDDGEGVGPTQIWGRNDLAGVDVDIDSDASGKFEGLDWPIGTYSLGFQAPSGYLVEFDRTLEIVEDDTNVGLAIPTKKSVAAVLKATIAFDKDTYAPGDRADLTVKLTNEGDQPLDKIVAQCNGIGNDNSIGETAEGWGDLLFTGKGVSVPAGETLTLRVWGIVPDAARAWGHVAAACEFGQATDQGKAAARDTAKVPGAMVTAKLRLYTGENTPAAQVKVVLVDIHTGKPTASATSAADGRLSIDGLPAGGYFVRLVGPWQITDENSFGYVITLVAGRAPWEEAIKIEPGEEKPDIPITTPTPVPTTPATTPATTTTPAPQASATPSDLPDTGANVIGLTLGGLAVLVAGVFAVVFARRRKHSA